MNNTSRSSRPYLIVIDEWREMSSEDIEDAARRLQRFDEMGALRADEIRHGRPGPSSWASRRAAE